MLADLAIDVVELAPCPEPTAAAPLREMAFRRDSWLPREDDHLRALFAQDASIAEISAALGRGAGGVSWRICELGLRRSTSRPWGEIEDSYLVEHYGSIATASIALHLGRSVPSIYARAQLLDLTEDNPPPYTDWEDAQIRAGYGLGTPVAQIGALIGRPFSGVVGRAKILGLRHSRKPNDWSDDEAARALVLAHEGHRYLAIVEMLVDEGFPRRSKIGFGLKLRAMGYGRGWGRAWLPEEDEMLRRAYQEGASLTPLRERLGRTVCSIRWRTKELRLQGTHVNQAGWRKGPLWTQAEEDRLRRDFGTMPTKKLAAEMGRNLASVLTRANVLGLNHPWMRAYRPEEDRAIAIAWRHGLALKDIADATGRDLAVVHKRAKRIGLCFGDPNRPAVSPRTLRRDREHLTLENILAIGEPAPFRSMKYRRQVVVSPSVPATVSTPPVAPVAPQTSRIGTVHRRSGERRPSRLDLVLQRRIRPRARRVCR